MEDYRAVIGFPRWTEKGVYAANGGTYNATYPVTNLNSLPLSRVARSSSAAAADTKFKITLDKPRPIRLLAFVRHNASLDATFRIRLYSDAALTTLLYDSGTGEQFWPPVYPNGTLEWEDDGFWSGQYSTDQITGYRVTRSIWLDQFYLAQAILVDVVDTTNPAGFFECGLFEVAQGWQVGVNFAIGAQYGFRARTQTIEALGGVKFFDRRDKPRQFNGSIDYLSRDEALARAFEHQRQHDLDIPFLWLPHPDDIIHPLRRSYLARNMDLGLLSYAQALDVDSVPLRFEEVL